MSEPDLKHVSHKLLDFLPSVSVFIPPPIFLIKFLLLEPGPGRSETERPEEGGGGVELAAGRAELVDQILHANNACLIAKGLLDNSVIGQRHPLAIDLAVAAPGDEVSDELLRGDPVRHPGLYKVEHLSGRVVVPQQDPLIDAPEAQLSQGLANTLGHSGSIPYAHGKNDLCPDRVGRDANHPGFPACGADRGLEAAHSLLGHGGNLPLLDDFPVRRAPLHPLFMHALVPSVVVATGPATGDELLGLDDSDGLRPAVEDLAVASGVRHGLCGPVGLHLVEVVAALQHGLGDQGEASASVGIGRRHAAA